MNSKLTTLYKHYEEIMQELSTDVVAKDIDRFYASGWFQYRV